MVLIDLTHMMPIKSSDLQARGQRFESVIAHHEKNSTLPAQMRVGCFSFVRVIAPESCTYLAPRCIIGTKNGYPFATPNA